MKNDTHIHKLIENRFFRILSTNMLFQNIHTYVYLFILVEEKEDSHDRCNIKIRVRREAAHEEARQPTTIVPWLRCRHSVPRGHESCRRMERYVALSFFSDVNFSTMPWPLLLSKLWPVRLISTRNSPQSRTFSCPMGIDPGGVVNLSWSQIHFMSFIPVTVLSDGGEFNKSKVK